MSTFEKYIYNGRVAVLYAPGFGAGWSTWSGDEIKEQMLMDKRIVELLLNGREPSSLHDIKIESSNVDNFQTQVKTLFDESVYVCTLGAKDLKVMWMPIGSRFRINEYHGSESIQYADSDIFTA